MRRHAARHPAVTVAVLIVFAAIGFLLALAATGGAR